MLKTDPKSVVKQNYPDAMCRKRQSGKSYFEIYVNGRYLAQGKTKQQAWKAAYNRINED